MARILVTGGAGYVGSHVAKLLAAKGHESVVFDNLTRGHAEFVRWGELILGDIRDAKALDTVFEKYEFDAVIHFAALAYVGESVVQPDLYYDVNICGTRSLLDAMIRADVKKIVFSSTCAVYGEPDHIPIAEDSTLAPVNPYGFTKLACERMMDDYDQAFGLRSVRLRYFNAAGADLNGEIGEWHEPETHLIPLVLDAASGRREKISIFGFDYPTLDGTAIRDYIHVEDLADAHVRALDCLLDGGKTIALNLGTGEGISVKRVIETATRITEKEISAHYTERRAGDPARLIANPRKAQRILGWKARSSSLTEIIQTAWAWHQSHFNGAAK